MKILFKFLGINNPWGRGFKFDCPSTRGDNSKTVKIH
jgi:hypothetical protein